MDGFRVTDVSLGAELPVVRRVPQAPHLDEWGGFWLELSIAYKGCFSVSIETKLNLRRITQQNARGTANKCELAFNVLVRVLYSPVVLYMLHLERHI